MNFEVIQYKYNLLTEIGDNYFGTVITLVMAVVFVVFIIWLAYKSSKWLAKRNIGLASKGKYINIMDRVVVGQDKYLIMVQAGTKHLLVGVSNNSVQVLTELEESEVTPIEVNIPKTDFASILKGFNNLMKKHKDGDGTRL